MFFWQAITQPMRQSYGWDGCRDRVDGRDDEEGGFEAELQWEKPVNRFSHRAVYSEEFHALLMFGGYACVGKGVVPSCCSALLMLLGCCCRCCRSWHSSLQSLSPSFVSAVAPGRRR